MNHTQLKQDVANVIKMLERAEHIDFNGHASVRVPGTNTIFINERKSSRSSLTAEHIIQIDFDGNVVEGNGEPPNEFPLHTEIYRNRDDVNAVLHTHPKWSTLFTITKVPLRPVIIQGAVVGEVPILQKSYSISNKEMALELVETLGSKNAVLMKAHGAALVGSNLQEAFARSVFLEENAYRQYMASQIGYAHSLDDEEIESMCSFIWQPKNIQKVWENHLSKLNQ
ncbi:class II aldolase/adducin family protein [Bacillus sp. Marseille-P3661]|uniref:class II aldolase/adducin family protein n=1 Tax=Bacillus sp. Marseille-P3661 TaxID=1936234 RepID=UPI000C84C354|nr:class II aldolase/adducin family protein [Bacillus sp. Marseille-P3661]